MRHALPLGTTTETWKALPQTDRWNCQPRRGVMLRFCSLLPPFYFPNYPLAFPPPFFRTVSPPHLLNPSDCDPCLPTTFKTLFTIAFTLSLPHDSTPLPRSLYPGLYSYLLCPIDRSVGSCLPSI